VSHAGRPVSYSREFVESVLQTGAKVVRDYRVEFIKNFGYGTRITIQCRAQLMRNDSKDALPQKAIRIVGRARHQVAPPLATLRRRRGVDT
jgi:hypothetical protein